ncbi:MAG: hypothetical protein KF862_00135 [Chitinophagaceae bacterium]|nr:hypothetical protein [Chitinophagaceae bacterium]
MSTFKITVDRKLKNSTCTQGYLSVNDKIIAYSLEKPDLNNINDISSIPHGTYEGFIRTDGSRGWRIELKNVPGPRTNIQIHVGNITDHTLGCILIGKNTDLNSCSVADSRAAMNELQQAFKQFTQDLDLERNAGSTVHIAVEIKGV